jgi:lysophospholipid acyltransferase (LPLAT)-like uncharacterized protein
MKRFLAWLSSMVIRSVGITLRMTVEDPAGVLDHPERPPVIIAFWHNRTALMALFYETYCPGRTALTFISRSRDGQFMTDVAACFGITAVRGSSSRHGTSAMLAAIRGAKDDKVDIAITPDGPRGPRYQLQPGILRLAQATERPIVAITYELKWKLQLKSWDRFHIPLPFSTCILRTRPLMVVPKDATDEQFAVLTTQLTESLGGD